MNKRSLRKTAKERIASVADKPEESRRITERLKELEEYRNAETILGFIPLSDEPAIFSLLAADSRVLFPYIENGELHFSASRKLSKAQYGAMEAEHYEAKYEKALMLVPLLGYSCSMQRLGRGGGYYDRYIAANRERIITAGIAFSVSCLEDFEAEAHDAFLDIIITPDSVVRRPVL